MENASKALLMAGGVLISIILVGLLLITFSRIGYFNAVKSIDEQNSQMAEFNTEFLKYIKDEKTAFGRRQIIEGSDLITLANKIVNFNQKGGTLSFVNYDLNMTLHVDGIKNFRDKYGYTNKSDAYFTEDTYTISSGGVSTLKNKKASALESKINTFNGQNIQMLKTLSSVATSNDINENIEKVKEQIMDMQVTEAARNTVKDYNGYTILHGYPKIIAIMNYKEYSEFKTSKFEYLSNKTTYEDNQIKELYFKFLE